MRPSESRTCSEARPTQLDRRQPATARARLSMQAPDVADTPTGRRSVPEHRDRDLADVARRDRVAAHVDDLDEQVLDGDVQPAELARRSDQPDLRDGVALAHGAREHRLQLPAVPRRQVVPGAEAHRPGKRDRPALELARERGEDVRDALEGVGRPPHEIVGQGGEPALVAGDVARGDDPGVLEERSDAPQPIRRGAADPDARRAGLETGPVARASLRGVLPAHRLDAPPRALRHAARPGARDRSADDAPRSATGAVEPLEQPGLELGQLGGGQPLARGEGLAGAARSRRCRHEAREPPPQSPRGGHGHHGSRSSRSSVSRHSPPSCAIRSRRPTTRNPAAA